MTKIKIIPSITLALTLLLTCVAKHERVSTIPHQEDSNRTKTVPNDGLVEVKTGGFVTVEPSNETSTLEMAGVFAPPITDNQLPVFQSADSGPRGVNDNKPNLPADKSETGSTDNQPRKTDRKDGDNNHKGNGGSCDDEDDDDGDDGDNAPKPSSDVNLVRDPRPDSQEHRWTSCMNLEDCYASNLGPTILENITSENKTAPPITFVQDNDKNDDTIQEKVPPITFAQDNNETTTTLDDQIDEKAPPIPFVQDNDTSMTILDDSSQDKTENTADTITGCEPFDVPNGNLQKATGTHVGDAASLLCNHGYKLEGESMVTCLPTGKWSPSGSCVVIDCSDPPIPPGASVLTPNGTLHGTVAYLSCAPGFRMKGNSTVTCQDDGSWSELPSCEIIDCGKPKIVYGEVIAPEGTTFGRTATLSCDKGYTLHGSKTVKCLSNGKWNSSATCKPKDCGAPVLKNGRVIAPEGTTFGSIATLVCDNGYIEHGHTTIRCLANGKWDGSASCIPNDCGRREVLNGDVTTPDGTTFGKVATIKCHKGYTLLGSRALRCLQNGEWNATATCEPKDCGKLKIVNGKMTVPEETTFGRTATLSCDNGYTLHGSKTVKCLSNGKWDGSASCKLIDCGKLKIANGKMTAPEGTTFDKTATLSCHNGYTLNGSKTVKCTFNGKWNGSATCKPKDCGKLKIANGKIVASEGTTFGKTAALSCDNGYTLQGSKTVKCTSDGTWDGSATCEPKGCGKLKIVNGKVTAPEGTTFGKRATLSCDNGYTLHGSKTVNCTSNGKWNGSATCEPKDCGTLRVMNGKMDASEGATFGKTATLSCDNGYTLHGSKTVKCSNNGKWDGSASCKLIDCGQPLIMNADISVPAGTTYGKSASIECRYGYTQHGDRTQTCTASGQWDGYTACKPKECGTPIVAPSVKVTYVSGTVFGSWFEFECKPGYNKKNPHRLRVNCLYNGQWDTATCEPVVCGTLPRIANSTVTYDDPSHTFGSTAQRRCNNGFELKDDTSGDIYPFTSVAYICAANGQWWISSRVKSQAITCTEKNECLSNPCMNNGKCEDRVNDYICKCDRNYNGKNCQNDIGPCSQGPCKNGGTCRYNQNGAQYCECAPQYENPTCTSYHGRPKTNKNKNLNNNKKRRPRR